MHLELLLEEPSAEAFFATFLSKIVPAGTTWRLITFQGKDDLLKNLVNRLQGYRHWIPEEWRIVVLVDEDRQNCHQLKARLEAAAEAAGLMTKSAAKGEPFYVLNRIAIEELEAWYLGDVSALCAAYPGVSPSLASKAAFRDPDNIAGGTWEALERVLRKAGYFHSGLGKIDLARTMAQYMDPMRNRSRSFRCLLDGMAAL